MKKIIFLLSLLLSQRAISQDSSKTNKQIKFGVEFNIGGGYLEVLNVNCVVLIKEKHQLGLGGYIIPAGKDFKGKQDFGANFNYDFYPNKINNRLDLFFNSFLIYSNDKYSYTSYYNGWQEKVTTNSIDNTIGFGFNCRLAKKINIKCSLSRLLMGYSYRRYHSIDLINNTVHNSSYEDFDYLELDDFGFDNLLLKIGVNYYFN